MSATDGPSGNGRARSAAPVDAWRLGTARFPACGAHRRGRGSLDESARRLSHEELAVALTLSGEGHQVRSLPERRGAGRTADLLVCGASVEVKSWEPLEVRAGRAPGARSVFNKLMAASEQGNHAVLYGRERALARTAVMEGVAEFARTAEAGRMASIRVLGDSFDLTWYRTRVRARQSGAGRDHPARRRRPPDPGWGIGR